MHPVVVRRILYFLLVTLLTNASGWTFNREAVADVFFAGQETASAGMEQLSLQASDDHEEPLDAKAPCTHWCHALGHFLGLFGQVPRLSLTPVADYFPQLSSLILDATSEGQFRPPRLLS